MNIVIENISNVKIVKAFTNQKSQTDKFEQESGNLFQKEFRLESLKFLDRSFKIIENKLSLLSIFEIDIETLVFFLSVCIETLNSFILRLVLIDFSIKLIK